MSAIFFLRTSPTSVIRVCVYCVTPPTSCAEHIVFDAYWLVGSLAGSLPSSAVGLFGALLRLTRRCRARLQTVAAATLSPRCSPLLTDWLVSLKAPPIRSVVAVASALTVSGIIWRGSLHFTESKVRETDNYGQLND